MANESFVNVISVNDTTNNTTEVYNIEAQRMSCGNVGTESRPVYFSGGVPVMCSEDVGGGGSNVQIIPDEKISSLRPTEKTNIATFSIDGEKGNLYIPKTTSGYQRQVIFNGQFSANTIGETQGAMLTAPFTNFEFLYIHIADTRNIVGNQVIVVSAEVLKNKLPHALVSCNLYGTLGIILEFDTPDHVILKQVNNLPNYSSGDTEDGYISVICTKIEGVTLGISSSSWGKNTKDTLWVGEISTADPSIKYTFQDEEDNITHNRTVKLLTNYDTIYVYGHILNEDEEHVDIGAVDFLANKLLTDKAILTCGTLANITKTLKFAEDGDGFYVIAGNDTDSLTYVITKIDGIKYGVDTEGGGGGDLSNCMMKGVDYVTAGSYSSSIGERATAEGFETYAYGNYSHAEGYQAYAGYDYSHAEGYQTFVYSSGGHAEGFGTSANGSYSHAEGDVTLALESYAHAEGEATTAAGASAHAEGSWSYAGSQCHAEGIYTFADISGSHAEGYATSAYGERGPHAEGNNTIALGQYCSHAEGGYTTSGGDYSHAEGLYTNASGDNSHTEGIWSKTILYNAYGDESSGAEIVAIGHTAHAEGSSVAGGEYSHSEGGGLYDYGSGLPAYEFHGDYWHDYHSWSDAGGTPIITTTTVGKYSHAEGFKCLAEGVASHAEGAGTLAFGDFQHVEGFNNVIDSDGRYAHIIGNGRPEHAYVGTGGGVDCYTPKNIFTVDWEGNVSCTAVTHPSSRKVKENIKDMTSQEAQKLLQLRPVSFDYIKNEGDKNCYGLIAEEVQEVGLNYPIYKGTMRTSSEECLQLDYSKFIPYLIKMVQLQEEKINMLEQKLNEVDF